MKPLTLNDVLIFPSAADFRAWLEAHHDTVTELWIGYYKKGVPKTSITYPEAVEEALCFGWIDGLARRIDDEVSALRFTPRRKGSNWSETNVGKMQRLIASGRAHPAGIAAFERRRDRPLRRRLRRERVHLVLSFLDHPEARLRHLIPGSREVAERL